jgi:hypothetical protein
MNMRTRTTTRFAALVGLAAMVVIGASVGDAVSADRAVLLEYFNATW